MRTVAEPASVCVRRELGVANSLRASICRALRLSLNAEASTGRENGVPMQYCRDCVSSVHAVEAGLRSTPVRLIGYVKRSLIPGSPKIW